MNGIRLPFAAQRIHIQTQALEEEGEGGGTLLWGAVGAVAAGGVATVVVVAAAGATVGAVCAFTPTCFASEPSPPIAFVNVSVAE